MYIKTYYFICLIFHRHKTNELVGYGSLFFTRIQKDEEKRISVIFRYEIFNVLSAQWINLFGISIRTFCVNILSCKYSAKYSKVIINSSSSHCKKVMWITSRKKPINAKFFLAFYLGVISGQ
jgi:hypothetical protein